MMEPMRKARTTAMIALLALATALAGCHEDTVGDGGDGGGEAWLGMVNTLSGPAASLGESGKKGMELAVKEINDEGGVDGKTLRVRYEDDKLDPTEGVRAFQALIADDKIQGVVGSLASGITRTLIDQADEAEVVLVSPSSTRADLTRPRVSDFFFRVIPSDIIQGAKAASLLFNNLEVDSTLVLYQNNAYATGLKDVFVDEYAKLGGTVQGDPIQFHASDTATYAGVANDAVAADPTHVYLSGQAPESAHMIKELRAAGYTGPILTTEAVEDQQTFTIAGQDAHGVLFTKPDIDVESQGFTTFAAAYEAMHSEGPGPYSAYAYDATYILADALGGGHTSGAQIRDHLQDGSFSGRVSTPTIAFNNDGDVTVGDYVLWEIRYSDGEGSFERVEQGA